MHLKKNKKRGIRRRNNEKKLRKAYEQEKINWNLNPNQADPPAHWHQCVRQGKIFIKTWNDVFWFRRFLAKKHRDTRPSQHSGRSLFISPKDQRAYLSAAEQMREAGFEPKKKRYRK